jgi:hypothetical protein
MGAVFGVEDAVDFSADLLFEIPSGDVGLGVLLEVELAALPGAGVEGGAVSHIAVDVDLVVGGVGKQVGDLGQRAVAPFFELPIQFSGELGDLGGGDVEAAKFTHDGGDAAGADALKIRARDGGFEGSVAAAAFLQKGGPERDVTAADLGCGEVESAHRGVEAAGFEAVGVAVAHLDAFIRAGTDVLGAFHEHGGVHEQFGDFGESFAGRPEEGG